MTAAASRTPDDDDDAVDDGDRIAGTQRLDKWLWFVRGVKSRTQASALVNAGKVRVNRERTTRAAYPLRADDVVTINVRGNIRVLKMVGPGARRGPAAEARALFEDLTPPAPQRAPDIPSPTGERAPGSGRPTKQDRRRLDRLRGQD